MRRSIGTHLGWLVVLGVAFILSSTSCSFTYSSENSSKSLNNSSDSSSSTSPSNWYFPGVLQNQRKVIFFSRANFDRLKEDMASGHGKYLTSLATLMEVPQAHHQEFFSLTKENFHDLFPNEQVTPEEMLVTLSQTLSVTQNPKGESPLPNG